MASSAGRAKRDREKARQERQQAKRDKRVAAHEAAAAAPDSLTGQAARAPQPEVLARLAALHEQFADGVIGFEEFEQTKEQLLLELEV